MLDPAAQADRRTEAEKRAEAHFLRYEEERAKKAAAKSHRERIKELNGAPRRAALLGRLRCLGGCAAWVAAPRRAALLGWLRCGACGGAAALRRLPCWGWGVAVPPSCRRLCVASGMRPLCPALPWRADKLSNLTEHHDLFNVSLRAGLGQAGRESAALPPATWLSNPALHAARADEPPSLCCVSPPAGVVYALTSLWRLQRRRPRLLQRRRVASGWHACCLAVRICAHVSSLPP